MDLIPWFPALTTTSLLAFVAWVAREAIAARLTRSIQHEFERKLESVRAELRAAEEYLKAEIREKEAEIAALRSGALSTLVSRQASLDRRRLDAVDQLWAAFNSLAPARGLAARMSVIKFEHAAKHSESDPKVREFFEILGAGFDIEKIDQEGASVARPFVSPMAWAVFVAYRAITMHSVMRWHILKSGFGQQEFTDSTVIDKLIVAALPHFSEYVQKNGPDVYYHVLEALEQKLLSELQAMLQGIETDKTTIEQAAEIVRYANALQAKTP